MRRMISLRWLWPVIWVVGLAALMATAQDMNALVREKGGYSLPEDYSSSQASQMEKAFSGNDTTTYVAVFHVDKGLSEKDMNAIESTLKHVKHNKEALKIESVIDSFDNEELENQFLSDNKKTLMAALQVQNVNQVHVKELRAKINEKIKTDGVETYLTGEQLINNDMTTSAEEGLKKTEGITVVFILIVLFLVFRSFVAPFIPLVTVGISYLAAQAVVAFLIKYINFPVSDFTQIFMVAIMFGIGTDYCILLMSRFKEELAGGADKNQAALATFKTAGVTVLHSGIPVLIAFVSLAFVQFNLYRSAVAVGIGIIILLLALFTLLPIFMTVLGKHLFWPLRGGIKEPRSIFWLRTGRLAFARPLLALFIVALFTVPPIVAYHGQLSFNSPEELPDRYEAKKGYNVVSADFGAGNLSPATIYLKNDDNMRTTDYIELIERISIDLAHQPNVNKVLSISRPFGDRLNDIYVTKQAETIHSGLSDASDGLGTLRDSLQNTGKEIDNAQPQMNAAIDGIDKLQEGTRETRNGIQDMQEVLTQISDGIKSGAAGASEIRKHVQMAQSQLEQLKTGQEQLQTGYRKVAVILQTLSDKLNQFSKSIGEFPAIDTSELEKLIKKIDSDLKTYLEAHPEAMEDPNLRRLVEELERLPQVAEDLERSIRSELDDHRQAVQKKIDELSERLKALKDAIDQVKQLNSNVGKLADAMDQLNSQSTRITNGLGEFQSGLSQLDVGLAQLEDGLNKAGSGQDQVIANSSQLVDALTKIESGQEQLKSGFGDVQGQMKRLSEGLADGAEGTDKIKTGVDSANAFIGNWAEVPYEQSGIYVPDQIFDNQDFQTALESYVSEDGKIAKIQVTMKDDPYSNAGISHFQELKNELPDILKGTKLENARIGISGIASFNRDLKQLSGSDYERAVAYVIIGVFIALTVVLRSLSMPIYLMASLLLTYYASMGFSELIFTGLFHYSGLTWTAQFFGFIVLVALGIDYSIFVMTRFNEYVHLTIKERMLQTLSHMGSVIFSAVIILSGTFAAMIPSGMLSLVEIATVVIIGLLLYAAVIIPLFVSAMVKLFGRGNWWPFQPKNESHSADGERFIDDKEAHSP